MGPLKGVRVVELAGMGPGPFAAAMLANMGAEVLRVARPVPGQRQTALDRDLLSRQRRSIVVDLKSASGRDVVLDLAARADVVLEGFRPGVVERLGVGPGDCLARNQRLVYGRMTGWGQEGPRAHTAGHDIAYLALSGALRGLARAGERPLQPSNFVGDFGGGGMLLACGVVAALFEAQRSGQGQVVDASILDGAAMIALSLQGMVASGIWDDDRPGTNTLDGGVHYYDIYETSDDRYVAVGALEPQFYAALVAGLDLEAEIDPVTRGEPERQGELRALFAKRFRERSRDEWEAVFAETDACFAPVLSVREAPDHPHNQARRTFVDVDGTRQVGAVPRFSRTPGRVDRGPVAPGADTDAALADWGFDSDRIAFLRAQGAVG